MAITPHRILDAVMILFMQLSYILLLALLFG
jgi:hypothetical protein